MYQKSLKSSHNLLDYYNNTTYNKGMKHFYSLIVYFLLGLFLSTIAHAQETERNKWNSGFNKELWQFRFEYGYYTTKYHDSSYFPADREQEFSNYIEDKYLKIIDHQILQEPYNPLLYIVSAPMAKLLLRYGGSPFDKDLLEWFTGRTELEIEDKSKLPDLTHQEVTNIVNEREKNTTLPWTPRLLDDENIAIIKLYLSLGTVQYFDDETYRKSQIIVSLYDADYLENFIPPDEKHRADDIRKKQTPKETRSYYGYYRSPVTYWLEEFIESGYPAEMLDTHKLLYPRFMKEASVEEIKKCLIIPKHMRLKPT